MEKPSDCASCGTALRQPTTGRPRCYCGVPCRRAAEYELKRVQALLSIAGKAEQAARLALAGALPSTTDRKRAKAWAVEVAQLEERLRTLLGGQRDTDERTAS